MDLIYLQNELAKRGVLDLWLSNQQEELTFTLRDTNWSVYPVKKGRYKFKLLADRGPLLETKDADQIVDFLFPE
jgi:hypothetical protein